MEQDYRKMNRRELEDRLAEKDREISELKAALEEAQAQLQSRAIQIEDTGSLADAAVKINGVFDAAQRAADQFLENIRLRSEETERICQERDSESREKAIQLLESTEARCKSMEAETTQKCGELTAAARQEADDYWKNISEKMEHFYREHQGLKELLTLPASKQFGGGKDTANASEVEDALDDAE